MEKGFSVYISHRVQYLRYFTINHQHHHDKYQHSNVLHIQRKEIKAPEQSNWKINHLIPTESRALILSSSQYVNACGTKYRKTILKSKIDWQTKARRHSDLPRVDAECVDIILHPPKTRYIVIVLKMKFWIPRISSHCIESRINTANTEKQTTH